VSVVNRELVTWRKAGMHPTSKKCMGAVVTYRRIFSETGSNDCDHKVLAAIKPFFNLFKKIKK
jgi:hypothetical protein